MNRPPRWPEKVLTKLCHPDLADEILGDLYEAFIWRTDSEGLAKAKWKYTLESIRSLKPSNLKSFYHLSLNGMIFKTYLKIALRNILIRKSFSIINILGLISGVATFLIIGLFAWQTLSFDNFHSDKDQIYLAYKERITPDGVQATYDTWIPMAKRLSDTYSEITHATGVYSTDVRIAKNNQYLQEDAIYTTNEFFKIFSFELAHGHQNQPFEDKMSVILNEDLAFKYFNKSNAVGESLEIFLPEEDTTIRFIVSGVLKPYPSNVSLQPQILIQMESIPIYTQIANNWSSSFLETYIKTTSSAKELEDQFPQLVETIWDSETQANTNFKLLPLHGYYDQFIGSKNDARTLLYIGIGIMLIAIINFMNLSTAQASQRSKEIGLRKVLGAFRGQIKTQFITEAMVISTFSTILGFGIVVIGLPYFNQFFGLSLSISAIPWHFTVAILLCLIFLIGITSGSYPAFYLSSIKVLEVLQQK